MGLHYQQNNFAFTQNQAHSGSVWNSWYKKKKNQTQKQLAGNKFFTKSTQPVQESS